MWFPSSYRRLTSYEGSTITIPTPKAPPAPPEDSHLPAIEKYLGFGTRQPDKSPVVTAGLLDMDLEHEKSHLWILH